MEGQASLSADAPPRITSPASGRRGPCVRTAARARAGAASGAGARRACGRRGT